MTATKTPDLRDRLRDINADISQARTEKAACERLHNESKAKLARLTVPPAELTRTPEYKAAERTRDDLAEIDDRIENLQEAQVGLLEMLGGDQRTGRNGPRNVDSPADDGFAYVAHELNLAEGRNRVNLPLGDLLRSPAMAAVKVTPSSGISAPTVSAPFMQLARDERHVWMLFPTGERLNPDTAAIQDYRQKGSRTVTGSVPRDPVATTSKAKLGLEVELVNTPLKQFAVVVEKVPSKLFDFIPAFQAFLNSEMAFQISLALDVHCLAQITAATPPSGLEGATLIEQVRNGVAAMRARGAKPSVLALSPTDAAALDVQTSGADDAYIFATRDTGSSSPLFGNAIVEVPNLSAPVLIDPTILGAMYDGTATWLADPFSGLDTNEVRLRCEMEALLHIRDIAGAYVIED
jgi:hypothetical protein